MTGEPARITAPFLEVLEAFLDAAPEELHGWAIIKASRRGGPTVYKILERLAEMGWVESHWEDSPAEPNRPRRRYYRLTGVGVSNGRALLAERRPARGHIRPRPAFGG